MSRRAALAAAALLAALPLAGCGSEQARGSGEMPANVKAEFDRSHAPPPPPPGSSSTG